MAIKTLIYGDTWCQWNGHHSFRQWVATISQPNHYVNQSWINIYKAIIIKSCDTFRYIPFSALVIYTTTSVVSKWFVHDLQMHYQQACLPKNTLFIGVDMPNRQKCVTTGPIETSKKLLCKSCITIANTVSQACHTVSNIYLQSRIFGIDTGSCGECKAISSDDFAQPTCIFSVRV